MTQKQPYTQTTSHADTFTQRPFLRTDPVVKDDDDDPDADDDDDDDDDGADDDDDGADAEDENVAHAVVGVVATAAQ